MLHSKIFEEMLAEIGIEHSAKDLEQAFPNVVCSEPILDVKALNSPPKMLGSYSDKDRCTFRNKIPYKRRTHFLNRLYAIMANPHSKAGEPFIPAEVLECLEGLDVSQPQAYKEAHERLRLAKLGRHYQFIFYALRLMGGKTIRVPYEIMVAIVRDFQALDCLWEQHKQEWGRKYFLSYYLTIEFLLNQYGIELFYEMPTIKCQRRKHDLTALYHFLYWQIPS